MDRLTQLKRKHLLLIMGIGLLAFYLAMAYAAQKKNISAEHGARSEFKKLSLKKALLNARIALAGTDSIGLVADLSDSMLYLELKGVPIHAVKITQFRTDNYFHGIADSSYNRIFSVPLEVIGQRATIEKEPIIVRNAPKDTAEAAQFIHSPDTIIHEPIRIAFTLGNDMQLILKEEKLLSSEKKYQSLSTRWSKFLLRNIDSVFFLEVPEHKAAIELEIPKNEAISLFRALPYQSKVVIRI